MMNVIDATSINSENAFNALSKSFAQIKTKLNTKMSKIKEFYESKEKNLSKIILWTMMTKFFNMIIDATRHECVDKIKKMNDCAERQVTRFKKNDQKVEKSGRENEKHDWKKHLSKDDRQTVENCNLDVFFTQDQRFFRAKIK